MLNYVWLALLVLGIGTALVTDISDQSRDKYRNGEKFPVEVILRESLDTSRTKTYNAQFLIDKKDFNRLYSERIDSAIVLPAKVTFNPQKRSASFVLNIPGSAPDIFRKTAKAAGDENDIPVHYHSGTSAVLH